MTTEGIARRIIDNEGSCLGISCNGHTFIHWLDFHSLNPGTLCPLLGEDCFERKNKLKKAKQWMLDNMETNTAQKKAEWKQFCNELCNRGSSND